MKPAQLAELKEKALRLSNELWNVDTRAKAVSWCAAADEVLRAFAAAPSQGGSAGEAELRQALQAMVNWYATHGTLHHTDVIDHARNLLSATTQPAQQDTPLPTDLKALAIQCGGLALRDDKCIAMDIDDLTKFAAALAGQHSERPAPAGQAVGRLSDDEIEEGMDKSIMSAHEITAFGAGVRWAEKKLAALAASQAERPAVKEDGK